MIRFSKYFWLYGLISGLVLVPGIFSLFRFGLRPAVDFTGGMVIEVKFDKSLSSEAIADSLEKQQLPLVNLQLTAPNTYLLRLKSVADAKVETIMFNLAKDLQVKTTVTHSETVGPVLGKELLVKSAVAALIAILGILLYVAYAFKNYKYGVSAVLALFHDLLVIVGCFSLLGRFFKVEVDTLFVTAFLTTMSFSVHDTIVVFDRIREYSHRGEKGSFETLCDRALTETMGRSLANSFTIIFMLLALVLMGGTTIQWFAVALLIGTVSGTYSSPFVATPILILWNRWERRKFV